MARTSVFGGDLTPRQKQKVKNLPPALKERAENKKKQASSGKSSTKPFGQRHGPDGKFVGGGGSGGTGGGDKGKPTKLYISEGAEKSRTRQSAAEQRSHAADLAKAPAPPKGWHKVYREEGHAIRILKGNKTGMVVSSRDGQHHHGSVEKQGQGLMTTGPQKTRAAAVKKVKDYLEGPAQKLEARVETFGEDKPLPESWSGTLVIEGSTTDDARMFSPGSLDWRDLPLPLAWQQENQEGHRGSVLVGRIDTIERDGDKLQGRGVFDLGSENGREAARLVRDGFLRGISIDVSVDDGQITVVETEDGRSVTTFSAGRILGATVLPLQAFAEASIQAVDTSAQVAASAQPQVAAVPRPTSFGPRATAVQNPRSGSREWVVASAPVHPPSDWFADPALDGPTPITVDETGRVSGHLATWDTCHTSFGEGAGRCVRPPRSDTSYAYFLTGELVTAEGDRIPVGHITVGASHAPLRGNDNAPVSAAVAAQHYDHSGWVAADVAAGEDAYGIWVAGALRPGLTAEALREFRSAPLSGDWRRIGGNLELVGALAVNVPGFPVKRVQTLVASGEPVAYIAFPEQPDCGCPVPAGLAAIAERIARSIGLDNASRAAALAERVGVS